MFRNNHGLALAAGTFFAKFGSEIKQTAMHLSDTWFLEENIDFEFQQYRLQAYLQGVSRCFKEAKLYPQLADVIFHYNNLVSFRENKRFLQEQFPRKVSAVNLQRLEVIYEQMLDDNTVMSELEEITLHATAQMKSTIEEGAGLYDEVERQVTIEPIGILPLYKQEGYLLLEYGAPREVRAYAYNHTLIAAPQRGRGLHLRYISTFTTGPATTCSHIKTALIRQFPALPLPAVYLTVAPVQVPLEETLLPVVQRSFLRVLG